jgi:hypothetical protein
MPSKIMLWASRAGPSCQNDYRVLRFAKAFWEGQEFVISPDRETYGRK